MRKKTVFLFSFQNFFQFLSRNFSDFWPKNFKNLSKLTSTCPEEQFVAWNFILSFETFRIFCRNLWHGSQNSIYVSRWKFAEEIFFLFFLSEFFSDFERKTFQTFGQKTSRICKNYLLRVQRNNLWLDFFLSFETFRIFCRNIWHGSQNSIYVSRVKIAEKNRFFVLFPEFFRILSKNFSDFWPKNFKKFSKLPTCPEEKFVTWNFFLKFWIVLDFLQKPSAWFSSFYLRVQSKNCGKNSFFCFFFQNFFEFWAKSFQTFGQKTSKKLWKLPSACPQEQLVALNFFKKFWTVLDFLQKHLAWLTKFYPRVQSKNCGKKVFVFFPEFFSIFEQKFFRLLAKKLQEFVKTTFYVSRGTICGLNLFSNFESFPIFCRNHCHGSQISIYQSRLKIAEKTVFWFFFSDFFRILREKFFRLSAKKLQKVVKTTFYVSRGTVCGLIFF